MQKPPITFRFSEAEYDLLEKSKQDNESINQCAARLLREKLGIKVSEGMTLDTVTLDDYVNTRVNSYVNTIKFGLESYIDERVKVEVHNQINTQKASTPKRGRPPKLQKDGEDV
jgi:hypothetical protein